MSPATSSPTFRDPAGSLVLEPDRAVRHIRRLHRDEVLEFVTSAFYRGAVARGDIVDTAIEDREGELRLIHPLVRVPSYPWEWTASQWQAAAELTLRLCEEGLHDGWILKDATPLNILFVQGRPVLVDALSFERRDPESGLWLAYGQYVRTFLLPLLMAKLMHWPLELTMFRRDGYEPAELYSAMGWRERLRPSAFWPITLPALLERKKSANDGTVTAPRKVRDPELALHTIRRMLTGLRSRTRAASPVSARSEWSEYTSTLSHYTAEESEQKRAWVQAVLEEARPEYVLDVGANTGEFSELAARTGAKVLALERDKDAAEQIARMSVAKRLNVETIHADLARPTPAVGWANAESSTLLARLEGRFDLVLMLAVIHHLLLLEQIPLRAIMELCARLTKKLVVVEWVPATDPMFVSLMRGRTELYGAITERDLWTACEGLFRTLRRLELGNGRVMFLLELEAAQVRA
jgi:SAM-dependent methyltransferase